MAGFSSVGFSSVGFSSVGFSSVGFSSVIRCLQNLISSSETDDPTDCLTEIEFREPEKVNLIGALNAATWKIWGAEGTADLLSIKPSTLTGRMKSSGIQEQG